MHNFTSKSWISCSKPQPHARIRLFCFPYAGGGASTFRTWGELLPPEIECCAVQLPGRENLLGEPLVSHLPTLLELLVSNILPHTTLPFAFFGHSMGAMISFELARSLRKQHRPLPFHLFVSAFRAPQLPNLDAPVYNLPEQEFIDELRRLKGTPDEILESEELRQLVFPILRADFQMCDIYQYTSDEPFACPISAFGGVKDNEVSVFELASWHERTVNLFTLRLFQEDHFFLHPCREPLVQAIATDLLSSLRADSLRMC